MLQLQETDNKHFVTEQAPWPMGKSLTPPGTGEHPSVSNLEKVKLSVVGMKV